MILEFGLTSANIRSIAMLFVFSTANNIAMLFGRPLVKRFALCYRTVVLSVLSVCNVGVLWPNRNGWMDQDAIWYRGRYRPRRHCVRWGPSSPQGAQPPIFGPCLLWSNGWMDQDRTWHGGRPRSQPYCVKWGPSSPPEKGFTAPSIFGPCLLWPFGHNTHGWIKMPLGTEVDLGQGHIVLVGDPPSSSPAERGTTAPSFRPMSIVAKR